MINPGYIWAYGRLAKEVKDFILEQVTFDTVVKFVNHNFDEGCGHLIEIMNQKNQKLGEVKTGRVGIRASLDASLGNLIRRLESEYSSEKFDDKVNRYANKDYSKLLDEEMKVFEKLPCGQLINNYSELQEFHEVLWPIRGQTGQDIWMIYYYFDKEHNYNWISDMTGLNADQIMNIRDKIREAIGPELVNEITRLEELRLNPSAG